MRPLYDTRSTPDVLLEVSRGLAKPIRRPAEHVRRVLERGAQRRPQVRSLELQAAKTSRSKRLYDTPSRSSTATPRSIPYHFMPYASQGLYDGSLAHLPWLQEMPDPMTSGMWCSWVEINEKKAIELGIEQGDVIEVTSTQGSVRAPAFLNPGIAPDAVAMPVGQGHTNFTRYASNRGVNPIAILAPATIAETGTLAWSATRVKIARVGEPDIDSLILFGGATRERPDWTHGRGDEH